MFINGFDILWDEIDDYVAILKVFEVLINSCLISL